VRLGEAGTAALARGRWARIGVLDLLGSEIGVAGLVALAHGAWLAFQILRPAFQILKRRQPGADPGGAAPLGVCAVIVRVVGRGGRGLIGAPPAREEAQGGKKRRSTPKQEAASRIVTIEKRRSAMSSGGAPLPISRLPAALLEAAAARLPGRRAAAAAAPPPPPPPPPPSPAARLAAGLRPLCARALCAELLATPASLEDALAAAATRERNQPVDNTATTTGVWRKDKSRCTSMAVACELVALPFLLRKALPFLNRLEIVETDAEGRFVTILKAGGPLDVTEKYPWRQEPGASPVLHARRDKRRGCHAGRVTRSAEGCAPRIEVEWGEPYGGVCSDTFHLEEGGAALRQETEMTVSGRKAAYTTYYRRV
jgi:hypothetical protein